MTADAPLLYESAVKIYPRRASGRYARLRILMVFCLLGFFYGAPWITLNGTPLIWFDLPHRQFHIFGNLFEPQDLVLLSGLLMVSAMSLFLVTTVAGRVWCGYACPQTVWTELFLWCEELIEGDRHQRMRLDKQAWGTAKLLRRGTKHFVWLVLGLFTGLSFVAYFIPARELFSQALQFQLGGWPLFWSLFYGFATWGNAGFMREQVCKYMCPYARFQSAMFDKDTVIISYDEQRGEPRKSRDAKATGKVGDCVNCTLCVQVCPTGIDIRKGLQYECIACAACVDVCNEVMTSVGKPRGLIRYTSSNAINGGTLHVLRGRSIGYAIVLAVLCIALGGALLLRSPLRLDILRDRHTLYREARGGGTENLYILKIENRSSSAHTFRVSALFNDGKTVEVTPAEITLLAGEKWALPVTLRAHPVAPPSAKPPYSMPISISVVADDDSHVGTVSPAVFLFGESP